MPTPATKRSQRLDCLPQQRCAALTGRAAGYIAGALRSLASTLGGRGHPLRATRLECRAAPCPPPRPSLLPPVQLQAVLIVGAGWIRPQPYGHRGATCTQRRGAERRLARARCGSAGDRSTRGLSIAV